MPAYAVSIKRTCRCGVVAKYEVFNARNAPQGYFCARHANEMIRYLDKDNEQ